MVQKVDLQKSRNKKIKSDSNLGQITWRERDSRKSYIETIPLPTLLRQCGGNLPLCNKCKYHYIGACRKMVCNNYGKRGNTANL